MPEFDKKPPDVEEPPMFEKPPEIKAPVVDPPINPINIEGNISEKDKQQAHYTAILSHFSDYYQQKSNRNHTYKFWFFLLTWVLLFGLIIVVVCCSWWLHTSGAGWKSMTSVAVSGLALLEALIILPKLIAKHLFPKDEDRVIVDLIEVLTKVEK